MVGGMTALHLAVLSNNLELVKLLVADPRIDYSIQFSGLYHEIMKYGMATLSPVLYVSMFVSQSYLCNQ